LSFIFQQLIGVDKINAPTGTVRKWEMGATAPQLENLEKVCEAFGIDISYFTEK